MGGGIRAVEDMRSLLLAGADKCSINSAAVARPALVSEAARKFGSQCVVVAVDAKRSGNRWQVFTHGGRRATGLDAVEWAREMARRGAGEILLTSMDRDGTRQGFDCELTRAVSDAVPVPVIASGGVGNLDHLADGELLDGEDVADLDLRGGGEADFLEMADGRDARLLEVAELGAGEIVVTSVDREGTGRGFDLDLTRRISEVVPIPVIASGGVGSLDDLAAGLAAAARS